MFRSAKLQLTGVVLLAAAWKTFFFFWDVVPFNADEAVVALMARHILEGERPVFFYGQAYMGSLDAFLIAAGFALFGQQVWVIRLVQMLLYLGTVAATGLTGRVAFGSWRVGVIGALLMAIPTVNVTLYTTATLGGYGEALLAGSLIVLIALVAARRIIPSAGARFPFAWFALWGFLAGGGLWANGLTLVYTLPAGIYLLWALWKCRRAWVLPFLGLAGLCFVLGSLPWWMYAIQNGMDRLVFELMGQAVAVETDPWPVRTGRHLVNFLLLGTTVLYGFRPPWEVRWLGLPMLPFVLAFWLAVIVFFIRRLLEPGADRSSYALLGGICGVLLAGFLFTSFGVDPSGRYFLPLAAPLALVAAQRILSLGQRPWQIAGLTLLVIGFQFWGTLESGLRYPPGLTTQFYEPTIIDHRADEELIAFLRQEGETRGYTNYWVAYPLAFQSAEELIFIPRLPYHLDLRYTPRDDRYAPYGEQVAQSQRVAYITTRNPRLDEHLRDGFTRLGVTWKEKQIGDYRIYYRLSKAVRPGEIDLGEPR